MEKIFDSIKIKVKKERIPNSSRIRNLENFQAGDRMQANDDSRDGFSQRLESAEAASGSFGAKVSQNDNGGKAAKFCDRIIRTCIYLLVFLMPLFFLPFTFEIFEFNKQYLLVGLTEIAFFVWLVKMIVFEKEIKIRKTPLNLPIVIFLVVMILSTIFSVDKISSIFGYYGRFNGSLLEILSLGILYFLILNNFKTKDPESNKDSGSAGLLNCFLASSFFAVIISFLSVFGILAKILPKAVIASVPILASRTFNTVGGSLEVLSIFLGMVIVLAIGVLISQEPEAKSQKYKLKFKNFLKFLLLAGSILLLAVINLPRLDFIKQFNDVTIQRFSSLPQEVVLDKKTAFEITKDSLKAKPILGSGPATFSYDFSLFRPETFNQNQYWAIRFDKAGSEVMERIATTGILGFISWLIIAVVFTVKLLSDYIVRKREGGHGGLAIPLFLSWFVLFIFQFLYLSNTTLNFCFWLFIGLGMTYAGSKVYLEE